MRIEKFDVVELNNNNKATILNKNNNKYYTEIVNNSGVTIEKRFIEQDEITMVDLDTDYNYTYTNEKIYRYQAVYNIKHY